MPMATGTEVHHANAKKSVSVTTLRLRNQAPTALRLKKPVTSAVVVGKVGHREKIMPNDYFMERIEWLEIVDKFDKETKAVFVECDKLEEELEEIK